MAGTYTTGWRSVSDGDTTTESPASLVGEDNIVVSNAEIQWEGVEDTNTTTYYETNQNSATVTATEEYQTETAEVTGTAEFTETTETQSNSTSKTVSKSTVVLDQKITASLEDSVTVPNLSGDNTTDYTVDTVAIDADISWDYIADPSATATVDDLTISSDTIITSGSRGTLDSKNTSYDKYTDSGLIGFTKGDTIDISADFTGDAGENFLDGEATFTVSVTVTATFNVDTNEFLTLTYPSVPDAPDFEEDYTFKEHFYGIYNEGGDNLVESETITTNKVGDPKTIYSSDEDRTLVLQTIGERTVVNSQGTTVAYPSVPSGYDFDHHYYREELNGDYVDSDFIFTNQVGDTRGIISSDPDNTRTLEMETQGEDTNVNTEYTQDPSVSGDVAASSSATLTDGEASAWVSLSGLAVGDNTLSHSIQDSREARYRIRFDWENAYPDELAVQRINANGTTYEVTLADPDDGALLYNTVQTYVSGIGYLAYDVVDPDNAEALPVEIHHPDHGTLRFRKR